MKTEVGLLNGTPDKRLYWSIISDYDLKTGLCELIDNAVDIWTSGEFGTPLAVSIVLDADQQFISVTDNAGGVSRADLKLLITPGGSNNSPDDETIGIFGVGSKRAVVALSQRISIKTRHHSEKSYQLDVDNAWLENPTWELPIYELPDFEPGTTSVELHMLRRKLEDADVIEVREHLAETYGLFLERRNVSFLVNGSPIEGRTFSKWAYPEEFPPHSATFPVDRGNQGTARVEVTAGLILDRDTRGENYGAYIYCNDRLIIKELRTRVVGYTVSAEAGMPHFDASLARVIIRFNGPAKLMPWNSSKTDVNSDNPTFQGARPTIIKLLGHFTRVSRALRKEWQSKVFPFESGKIVNIEAEAPIETKRLALPPLPRVNRNHAEVLKDDNKKVIVKYPWTSGLVESMAAVDMITRQRLETRNRIALILLDSTFEIGLKEFIVHKPDLFGFPDLKQLFKKRDDVIKLVVTKVAIPDGLLRRARHYYDQRNKLIHERATVGITNEDVDNYREVVSKVLNKLFYVKL